MFLKLDRRSLAKMHHILHAIDLEACGTAIALQLELAYLDSRIDPQREYHHLEKFWFPRREAWGEEYQYLRLQNARCPDIFPQVEPLSWLFLLH